MANTNYTKYSSCNTEFPKGSARETEYASAKALSKAGSGKDQGRAPGYMIEQIKK